MNGPQGWPAGYVPDLMRGYIAWIIITVGLYYVCRWFAGVKQRHDNWILKYL